MSYRTTVFPSYGGVLRHNPMVNQGASSVILFCFFVRLWSEDFCRKSAHPWVLVPFLPLSVLVLYVSYHVHLHKSHTTTPGVQGPIIPESESTQVGMELKHNSKPLLLVLLPTLNTAACGPLISFSLLSFFLSSRRPSASKTFRFIAVLNAYERHY